MLTKQLKMITTRPQDNVCSILVFVHTKSFMIKILSQLEALVATLSEAVGEGNEVDQTEANFNAISNTLANITSFITGSNVMINETVSGSVWI